MDLKYVVSQYLNIPAVWPPYIYFARFDDGAGGDAQGDAVEDGPEGSPSGQSSSNTGTRIRTEFPETWLWADFVAE